MTKEGRSRGIIRWLISALLVFVGLSATWAWGEVARLAEPDPRAIQPQARPLYGIWQAGEAGEPSLYRSTDGGQSWQLLGLPPGLEPLDWAQPASPSQGRYLAVVTDGGTLVSTDGGDSWATTLHDLEVLSLAWGEDASLYLGTDRRGVYHLPAGASEPVGISANETAFGSAAVTQVAVVPHDAPGGGRLFAAAANDLLYTDDGGQTWQWTTPVGDWIAALAVVDASQIYAGTETSGVYRSLDGGQSWEPAREGLGLAAGQMVKVTALRADPERTGVLYAAIDHVLGATEAHASAAGVFVSLDSGTSWQPLAGPAFPNALHAANLVLLPDQPLHVDAVTARGRQAYAPDIAAALAAIGSPEPSARAAAARLLGLARVPEAGEALRATLTDAEPAVSLAAARALGLLADPATAGPLLVALEHPAQAVRLGAARALGMMGAETAVAPLRDMLLQGEGQEITVAAEALGQIASPAAINALLVPLEDLTLTARRHAALGALEALGEPAVEPLVQQLDSPSGHIRRNAAEALGWVAAPSAEEALLRVVRRDDNADVRARAAWALGQTGTPAAQATLARVAAGDPAMRVRSAAEQALTQLTEQPGSRHSVDNGWRASRWISSLAPALNRLQPLRWLFLAFSLAAAAWLAAGRGRLAPVAHSQGRGDR